MSEFDPYYEWLGIPVSDQPANHYRLLSIPMYELNVEVIKSAAERQTMFLRTFHAREQSNAATKLLNEVAGARACLLNPRQRVAYDTQLRLAQPPPQQLRRHTPQISRPLPDTVNRPQRVSDVVPPGSAPSNMDISAEEARLQEKKKQLFRKQPFPGNLFSFSIGMVRDNISVQAIMDSADYSRIISNLLLAINMVLILITGLVALLFTGTFEVLLVALPIALGLVLLSYVNNRSLEGIRTIVNDEFTVSTTAFFDIVSAFLIACLYFSPFLLCLAIYQQEWYSALGVVGLFVLVFYCAVVTTNPGSLGFKESQNATTADDAIGLLAYIVKIGSSAAPYFYLLANIACIIAIAFALVGPLFEEPLIELTTDSNDEHRIDEDGDGFEIAIGAYSLEYLWLKSTAISGGSIKFLAIPLFMYLASLISLASVYVLKAIVDSARHLKNI